MKTGHRPAPPRCSLAAFLPENTDFDKLKREAWKEHGMLIANADDARITRSEANIIENIGNRLFGARHG